MIDKTVFFIWIIWYLNTYGYVHVLFNLIVRLHNFSTDFFIFYNNVLYPDYWTYENLEYDNNDTEINTEENQKKTPKYEDKYLEDIKKLDKDWEFTEDENNELIKLIDEFCNDYIKTKENIIKEITAEIINLENEIDDDSGSFTYIEDCNDDSHKDTIEDRNKRKRTDIEELQEEVTKIKFEIESEEGLSQINKNSVEQARQYIINKRLDKLKNCYIIEKTPNGNVIMIYDKERETFKYYSDINIPYKYLEVVGRKYVKSFDCRPIFVDIEEELRLFEEKLDKEELKKEEDKIKADEIAKNKQPNSEVKKKNVFAQFKSYNKDAGGKISMAPPPKNSIPNSSVTQNKKTGKIILKERANRYTCEGKFTNFNFLQKVDRKIFNKKLGLSFSDFKKMKK